MDHLLNGVELDKAVDGGVLIRVCGKVLSVCLVHILETVTQRESISQ